MPVIESETTVPRTLPEVWDLWTDVRRLPELSASTVRVLDAPDRLRRVGDEFTQVAEGFGREIATTWTVEEIVEGSHMVVTSSPVRGVHVRLTERVEAVDATPPTTRATLRIEYDLPFGPAGRMVSRLGVEQRARREAGEVIAGLQRLLASPPAAGRDA